MSSAEDVLAKPLELAAGEIEECLDLGEVYRRHARDVMRWATRLTGRACDAADIAQEVFCVVQGKLSAFRPGAGRLTTWLFRITENVVRARRRKEKLVRFLFGDRELPDVPSDALDPHQALCARSDVALVYRALDALSEKDRTALVMFELEGLSGEQVAQLIGVQPKAIWVRLHRARQRFMQRLAELEPQVQP